MSRGTQAKASGEGTRERLLEAAAEVIGSHGWSAATTRSVAQQAGVNKALVHYHFGSVDALLVKAIERVFARQVEQGMAMVLAPEDPADGLDDFADWLGKHPPRPAADRVLIEALSQATYRVDVRGTLVPALTRFRHDLEGRLHRFGSRNASALATAVAACLDGVAIHRTIDHDLDARAAVRAMAALIREARQGG